MFINESELRIVQQILKRHVPKYEVWAFGSRVHGEHLKNFSDLDLAIVSDGKLPDEIIFNLKDDFVESDLPFKVDILKLYDVDKNFQEIISQNYKVIQKPNIPPS